MKINLKTEKLQRNLKLRIETKIWESNLPHKSFRKKMRRVKNGILKQQQKRKLEKDLVTRFSIEKLYF